MTTPRRHAPARFTARLRPAAALRLAVLLLALALALAACQQRSGAEGDAGAAGAPAGETAPAADGAPDASAALAATQGEAEPLPRANVEVMKLAPRDFAVRRTYIGNLQPDQRVELRAEIEGVVEKITFDESDRVARGEILVNISTSDLTARRDLARTDFELAESDLRRAKELAARKLIPESQLDEAQSRRDVAFYQLKLARLELDKSVVESPIAGRVKTRAVSRGEFVNKGQLLAEILDIARVRARINVPERDIRFIDTGKAVTATLDALPGRSFEGRVKTVGLEADTRSRSFPVEVVMDNRDGDLRPGMLARVAVRLAAYERQVLIPRYAIVERESGPVVFVARDGRAVQRAIVTGESTGGLVQVLEGLEFGEPLIVTGQQKLSDGEPVTVQRELPLPAEPEP